MSNVDLRPKLGRSSGAKASHRFLLVCFFDPSGISTVYENIALWQAFSRYRIEILNLWPGRGGSFLTIPDNVELDDYAGIIIHSTVSYFPSNLYSLDTKLARPFEQYDGVKVLMKQDEHVLANKFATYIGRKAIDLVVTCVSPEERAKVYPPEVVGEAAFFRAFTGYVSPFMRGIRSTPIAGRPLDITYRGSIQPLSLGRLGFEKRKIGDDVSRVAANYALEIDISSQWADRIGGTAWFDFLGRSKAVLGVETGPCLFDFDGEVEAWCVEFEKSCPQMDHLSEEFYRRAHQLFLHKFEGNVNYAQISPRHLEAAATGTLQILYEGHYSGVLVPHRHFVPLARDLSNFEEAVEFLADGRRANEMVERAFEEVVRNREYHYETFVERYDDAVDRVCEQKGRKPSRIGIGLPAASRPRALLLMAHEPMLDPRVEWMAHGLSNQFDVCEVGINSDTEGEAAPSYERVSPNRVRVRIGRRRHDWDILLHNSDGTGKNCPGLEKLLSFHVLAGLPPKLLQHAIGALDMTEQDLGRFRWLARYFIHTNGALAEAGRLIGNFDLIVATDLETLPAALVLARESGALVLYDAHEFWPYADLNFRHWEVEFWSGVERDLLAATDFRVTVSPHLARRMSEEYGQEFTAVPNCVSVHSVGAVDVGAALQRQAVREEVNFLFLGVFAPGRGIEDLIRCWAKVDVRARLVLQGPENEFRREMVELARSLGLLDCGISFPKAVQTSELIEAARQADIGVIPYAASSINNLYCCPNKLSQYLAAGLPIVCNRTEFVKSVVEENELGYCVDFSNYDTLAQTIGHLAMSKEEIADMSRRAQQFFRDKFNWEHVSRDMYGDIAAAVGKKSTTKPRPALDFSWIEQGREMRQVFEEGGSSLFVDTQIQQLHETYSGEIARLNKHVIDQSESYLEELSRLKRHISSQNDIYLAETTRLNEYINEQSERFSTEHRIYTSEIARLTELIKEQGERYSAEQQIYGSRIARPSQYRDERCAGRTLIGTMQQDEINHDLNRRGGWKGWCAASARKLALSSVSRVLARRIVGWLPDKMARRVKTGLVLLLDRR